MPGSPLRCSFTNLATTAFVVLNYSHRPTQKINNQPSKTKETGEKRSEEVWLLPRPTSAMRQRQRQCALQWQWHGVVDDSDKSKGKDRGGGNCCSEGSSIGNNGTEGNVRGTAEAWPTAVAAVAVRATILATMVVVVAGVVTTTAAVTLAATAAMVTAEARGRQRRWDGQRQQHNNKRLQCHRPALR
jgi:hypothetical protein